jgi:hypothetical protein
MPSSTQSRPNSKRSSRVSGSSGSMPASIRRAIRGYRPESSNHGGWTWPTSALSHFVTDVWVLTKRSIARIRREPETLADVTFQPVIFILMFAYVFGGAIALVGGGNYHE